MGAQQQMIHAAVLHGIGETPRYEPFPAPAAGDGEAVVTVTGAALKPSDRLMADGVHYAPATFPRSWAWTAWAGCRTAPGWRSSSPSRPTAGWFGSGIGGAAALGDGAAAYDSLLQQVAAGDISLDVDPVPLATVEQAWPRAGSDRRIVFVP
jgi:hypothetical protein